MANIEEIKNSMRKRALKKSRKDVILLASIFEYKKYRIDYPNDWQDINEHWDVLITRIYSEKVFFSFKVDVKGNKKGYRENDSILLELRNVIGNKGWMYGLADGMAFERENDFVYVKREALLQLIIDKVDNWDHPNQDVIDWKKVIVTRNYEPDKVHYQLINRKEDLNDDIFVYVPYSDIKPLIKSIIPKDPTKKIEILKREKVSNI